MKIEMGKTYKTRSGLPVRLLSCEGAEPYSVVGVAPGPCELLNMQWSSTGEKYANGGPQSSLDLVEVRQPFTRNGYAYIYIP